MHLHILSAFLGKHILEIFDLFSGISNFIHASVESGSSLHFRADFLFSEQLISILHRENLVIDSSVISLLVFQVIELLAELSDELILVTASNLYACVLTNISFTFKNYKLNEKRIDNKDKALEWHDNAIAEETMNKETRSKRKNVEKALTTPPREADFMLMLFLLTNKL